MSSAFRNAVLLAALGFAAAIGARELRVCADPDNLPFSSEDGSGFENRIADLVASHLHADLRYFWLPDRRGFLRKTLNAHACDLVMGLPAESERALTTRAYYRGTYVFVYRGERIERLESLDDPRLRTLRIGVALVGNDLAATPPALALAQRGIVANVTGFAMFGEQSIGQRMTDALREGAIDVAVLWGPQAGYYARRGTPELTVTPIAARDGVPATFDIAMGVRRDDAALRDEVTAALSALKPQIDAVLDAYAVARIGP
jgi:mxaJ protein